MNGEIVITELSIEQLLTSFLFSQNNRHLRQGESLHNTEISTALIVDRTPPVSSKSPLKTRHVKVVSHLHK